MIYALFIYLLINAFIAGMEYESQWKKDVATWGFVFTLLLIGSPLVLIDTIYFKLRKNDTFQLFAFFYNFYFTNKWAVIHQQQIDYLKAADNKRREIGRKGFKTYIFRFGLRQIEKRYAKQIETKLNSEKT